MDSPFENKSQIESLVVRADDYEATQKLITKFRALKQERHPFYLTADELHAILKWKLRGQFGRQAATRTANTNENIVIITKAAFSVTHPDEGYETKLKLKILSTLSGVEVPVASAILTLCYPEQYSVIDYRNWRQVYPAGTQKRYYTPSEYVAYLKVIREWAAKYGVMPQEIDLALWQKDIEEGRN